jgi:tRNA-(ms[2]io[6]A)-hydroxylase
MLLTPTPSGWFSVATRNLEALFSDHLHCERKAAENALSLVRRYPLGGEFTARLARLAHEETSHMIQVAELITERGLRVRPDTPNRYARALFGETSAAEPARRADALLVSALIEARSYERLDHLARGFAAAGEARLAAFYAALAGAEDRHATLFVELATSVSGPDLAAGRLDRLQAREAEIIANLPAASRIH